MIYQIQPFETLPLKHTFMFGQVMQKPEICQLFLEELFGWNIERIEYVDREKDITDRYLGRGIRLDIYIRNSDAVYNIEMQSQEEKSLERRIRFYQSGIDREELRRGVSYESLPETYIIFICDYDPIKVGNAVYERKAFWDDPSHPCNDGTHAILLNSTYKNRNTSPAILEFLDYIHTNDDAAEYSSSLARQAKEQVHRIRLDKEVGEKYMLWELEMQQAEKRGRKAGELLLLINQICRKITKGKSIEMIADELEEDISVIEPIYKIAEQFSPDFDIEQIYEKLKTKV